MQKLELDNITIPKKYIKSVVRNIEYNELIVQYYRELQSEYYPFKRRLENKERQLRWCNKWWEVDIYKQQHIKDFKRTNLCRDKFCNNCKKVKQAERMAKFIPELQKYKSTMFHMVLTSPNINGEQLKANIEKQFKKFPILIGYLKGKEKIRGIDFKKYGYLGAVRSLEVSFDNSKAQIYHPHLHCAFVLTGVLGKKNNINTYSYKFGKLTRQFSEFEIIIQKIWYLLMNDITVTKSNLDSIKEGYSCTCDKFKNDDYNELFKYMTKVKEYKEDEEKESQVLTYNNFSDLYFALDKKRQIQGYGCLFNIVDDTEDISEEVNTLYDDLIMQLKEIEEPVVVEEKPQAILEKYNNFKVISRKRIFEYLRSIE